MFGRFAVPLVSFMVAALPCLAQTQRATVTNNNAAIYRSPDFSSQVLGRVKAGTQWVISTKTMGLFYQIQIRPGLTGYIAESDLSIANRPTVTKPSAGKAAAKRPAPKAEQSYLKPRLPFRQTNFWGISLGLLRYKEQTMGLQPSANVTMIGVNMSGPQIVLDGYPTVFNFAISTAPPSYYQQATGESVEGFLLTTNFLLQFLYPSGRDTMSFFGFGPMYKFSRYSVIGWAPNNSGTVVRTNQQLDDMTLGLVFNAGFSLRMNNFALRTEVNYYWEKQQYFGLNLSGQFAF